MKVKCENCVGEIIIPDDSEVGDVVSCPDCSRNFEILVKDGKNVQLLWIEPYNIMKNLSHNEDEAYLPPEYNQDFKSL